MNRKQAPYEFEPYKAEWGEVRTGNQRYVCISFNFDGIGRSVRYLDIRGAYLIDRKHRAVRVYYVAGNVRDLLR